MYLVVEVLSEVIIKRPGRKSDPPRDTELNHGNILDPLVWECKRVRPHNMQFNGPGGLDRVEESTC